MRHTSNPSASKEADAAISGYRAKYPRSMTGWVCDFQPQEAQPSSRRLASRIEQVMSAFQWIGSPCRVLSGSCSCTFLFDPHIPAVRLSSVLVEEPLRDNPVVASLGFVGNATAHLPSKVLDDIKSGHRGPNVNLTLAKSRTHILSVSKQAHENCAGRVPSVPVAMLVFRLANALASSMRRTQLNDEGARHAVVRDARAMITQSRGTERIPQKLSDFCGASKWANQNLHAVDHIFSARGGLVWHFGGQRLDRWSESEAAKHPPEISRRIIIHGHVTSLPGEVRSNPLSVFHPRTRCSTCCA